MASSDELVQFSIQHKEMGDKHQGDLLIKTLKQKPINIINC